MYLYTVSVPFNYTIAKEYILYLSVFLNLLLLVLWPTHPEACSTCAWLELQSSVGKVFFNYRLWLLVCFKPSYPYWASRWLLHYLLRPGHWDSHDFSILVASSHFHVSGALIVWYMRPTIISSWYTDLALGNILVSSNISCLKLKCLKLA